MTSPATPRHDTCIPHTVAIVSDRSLSASAVLYWAMLGHAGPLCAVAGRRGRAGLTTGPAAVARVEPWTPVISQPWNLPWTELHSEPDPLTHTPKHTHTRCNTLLSLGLNLPQASRARLAPAIRCALPVDNPCFPKTPTHTSLLSSRTNRPLTPTFFQWVNMTHWKNNVFSKQIDQRGLRNYDLAS